MTPDQQVIRDRGVHTPCPRIVALLVSMLEGSSFATAIMPWGRPGPVKLPNATPYREALVMAHIQGTPALVNYAPLDGPAEQVRIGRLVLGALCPDSAGRCRWVAFDLDAADGHGPKGLRNPTRAMRCLAERATTAGLSGGLVVARSRGGHGYHLWLLLPQPIALDDAVVGAAALVAMAYRVAATDAADAGVDHAFLDAKGGVVPPGTSGAVEILPRSTTAPARGWALTLPGAASAPDSRGGLIVDPFADRPVALSDGVHCDAGAWATLVREARGALPRKARHQRLNRRHVDTAGILQRLHPDTKRLLAGDVPVGNRNSALFASTLNMLGCGATPDLAVRMALEAGQASGLCEREVGSTVKSAIQRWERDRR